MARNNLPSPSPDVFHSFKLRLALFVVIVAGLVVLACYASCSPATHVVNSKENVYAR